MADPTLRNCRVLVVEDEYLLADALAMELEDAGATAVGPVGTLEDALSAIDAGARIDGAVLDVNLRGEMVYPVADSLLERGVPFVFTTGYDSSGLPPRFEQVIRCQKPINMRRVTQAIAQLIHP
jgi:DNA-binding NtrC family response regulator